MKERFIVATAVKDTPDLTAFYWFESKEDAIREAQRRRQFYTKEENFLLKVLNIPKGSVQRNEADKK